MTREEFERRLIYNSMYRIALYAIGAANAHNLEQITSKEMIDEVKRMSWDISNKVASAMRSI